MSFINLSKHLRWCTTRSLPGGGAVSCLCSSSEAFRRKQSFCWCSAVGELQAREQTAQHHVTNWNLLHTFVCLCANTAAKPVSQRARNSAPTTRVSITRSCTNTFRTSVIVHSKRADTLLRPSLLFLSAQHQLLMIHRDTGSWEATWAQAVRLEAKNNWFQFCLRE